MGIIAAQPELSEREMSLKKWTSQRKDMCPLLSMASGYFAKEKETELNTQLPITLCVLSGALRRCNCQVLILPKESATSPIASNSSFLTAG